MNYVTSKFGPRTHPVTGEANSFHNGVDITGDEPYLYTNSDKMKSAKAMTDKINGNKVIIDLGSGYRLIICHLEYISEDIVSGKYSDSIPKDTFIGKMGTTGRSTGPHFHFSIATGHKYLDPSKVINNLVRWRK